MKEEQKAKYVFYFIGDGMGFAHVSITEAYKAFEQNGDYASLPLCFTSFPVLGCATTYSDSNNITDSAASGTALATGSKTTNGMIGTAPDSTSLTSIAYKIQDAGYKVGITTTVNIDHATPAVFYANSVDRNNYYAIGSQLATSGFDFFAGGSFGNPTGKSADKRSLFDITKEAGYTIAYGMEEFNAKKGVDKMVLFDVNNGEDNTTLEYTLDRTEGELSQSDLVKAAIEQLSNSDGFFLMSEGGLIDWGGHSNDLPTTIFEILSFDEAIQVAYEFYKKHPENTLIVVTADHATGGLTLSGEKYRYDLSPLKEYVKPSNETNLKNYMTQKANTDVSDACGIKWTTGSHTADQVPVWAVGAQSSLFAGRMDNTDIPMKICRAMGVEF